MMPQVLLVHGFNVWDGGLASVAELSTYFEEYDCPVHVIKYGHFGLWDVRTKNDNIALQVATFIGNSQRPVIVVGHSNGAAIIYLSMILHGAKPARVVYINPALNRDIDFPTNCPQYDVWHSPSDRPVGLAKYLLPTKFRPWGDMGAVGPTHRAPHIHVYNKEHDYCVISQTHSDVFLPEKIAYFGPLIASTALGRRDT